MGTDRSEPDQRRAGLRARRVRPEVWQGYSAATSIEDAVAHFRARFDKEPADIKRNGGALLLLHKDQHDRPTPGQRRLDRDREL